MQIFIDTANIKVIEQYMQMGLIDGVTTNPSLLKQAGANQPSLFKSLICEICELVNGPVSAEVTSNDICEMEEQANELSSWHHHVVVKLPANKAGFWTLKQLPSSVRTNMTLVFQPIQAMLVGKHNATYASPFLGRIDDLGYSGMSLLRSIKQIYRNYSFETKILAASIRTLNHVVEVAEIGVDAITIPPDILEQIMCHQLTEQGVNKFMMDWNKT